MSKTIAIDFDGVIFPQLDYTKAREFDGAPLCGAQEALAELRVLGYRIVIHTARLSADFIDMNPGTFRGEENDRIKIELGLVKWLEDHNVPFDCIWTEQGKPHAHLYLDDKGIRHINWEESMQIIRERSR